MFEYVIRTSGYKYFSLNSVKDREKFKQIHRITTHDVRDCLFVYIKCKNFKIVFHLHKNNNPHAVLEKLLRDVNIDEKLDIYIHGGNFVSGFFPWNLERFDVSKQKEEYQTINDVHEYLKNNNYPFFSSNELFNVRSALDLFDQIDANVHSNNEINFNLYHEKLKNFKFSNNESMDEHKNLILEVKNGKDTTSYQNFSAFLYIVNSLIINKNVTINKINHYYNSSGSSVHINFSKEKLNELIQVHSDELIEDKKNLMRIPSIKKSLIFNRLWLYCKVKNLNDILTLIKKNKLLDALLISIKIFDFNLSKDIIEIIRANQCIKSNKIIEEMNMMIDSLIISKEYHVKNKIKKLMEIIKECPVIEEMNSSFFYSTENEGYSLEPINKAEMIFLNNKEEDISNFYKLKKAPLITSPVPGNKTLADNSGIKRNGIFKETKYGAISKHFKFNPESENEQSKEKIKRTEFESLS